MPPRKKTTIPLPLTIPLVEEESKKTIKEKDQFGSIENVRTQVIREMNNLFDLLTTEIKKVQLLRQRSQEEEETRKRLFKQQEEEYNLNTILSQRKKQAEFDEKLEKEKHIFEEYRKQKENEFKLQKEEMDKKREESTTLKTQVEAFPQILEKTNNETKKQITNELKKESDMEKKFLMQKYEAEAKLLQQHIFSLQQQIKSYEKDTLSLKEEKNKATDQMRELAVTVIQGKEKNQHQQTESIV